MSNFNNDGNEKSILVAIALIDTKSVEVLAASGNIKKEDVIDVINYCICHSSESVVVNIIQQYEGTVDFNQNGQNDVEKPIIYAANLGRLLAVKALVKSGVSPNSTSGVSALSIACINSHLPVVEYLLEAGAKVNDIHLGNTALCNAIKENEIVIAKTLIRSGADINLGDVKPLKIAKNINSSKAISLLIKNGAKQDDPSCNILEWACANLKNNIATIAIKYGADVNQANDKGVTPIISASMHGVKNPDLVKMLLQEGADPNYHAEDVSDPALYYAIKNDDISTAEQLLEYGADYNAFNYMHRTLIAYAEWSSPGVYAAIENSIILRSVNDSGDNSKSEVHTSRNTRRV